MSHQDQSWTCVLLDISLKGLLIEPPSDIEPVAGDTYGIELVLSEDATIRMDATIRYSNPEHWGLQWENIDLEGLTHLRRLLELNIDDPDKMHRELADLG